MLEDLEELEAKLRTRIREDAASFSPEDTNQPIDRDPLGAAFYSLLWVRYGFVDEVLSGLREGLSNWVRERISEKSVSSYVNRDISALCLAAYCFEVSGSAVLSQPERDSLLDLVRPHFKQRDGFFSDLFESALIALWLHRCYPAETLTKSSIETLRKNLADSKKVVLNDSKALFASYLLAEELSDRRLQKMLASEAFEKIRGVTPRVDAQDSLYISLVAIEGFEFLDRGDRSTAKSIFLRSLEQVRSLAERGPSDTTQIDAYGKDSGKPSRLLLSTAQAFVSKLRKTQFAWYEADSSKSVARGILSIAGNTAILFALTYGLHALRVVPQPTKGIASQLSWGNWLQDLVILLRFCINVAYIQVVVLYAVISFKLFRNLIWLRNNQDWVYVDAWRTYKQKFSEAVFLGVIIALVSALILG